MKRKTAIRIKYPKERSGLGAVSVIPRETVWIDGVEIDGLRQVEIASAPDGVPEAILRFEPGRIDVEFEDEPND